MFTVSDLKDYIFCPRLIYFKKIHKFKEPLKNNALVQEGALLHKNRLKYKQYSYKILKGFNENKKEVKLFSQKLNLCGVVDEIFFYSKEIIPVEYKFSKYTGTVYDCNILQLTLYAYLIKTIYKVSVKKGYLFYIKDKVVPIEIIFQDEDFLKCDLCLKELELFINSQEFPEVLENKEKCNSCYFRKICV